MTLISALKTNIQFRRNAIATIDGPRELTWAETGDRVARAAAGLRTLGLEPGDRVGILALNSALYLEVQLAVWWAGGAVVPMNTRFSNEETLYSVRDSGLSLLVCDREYRDQALTVREAFPGLELIFIGEGDPGPVATFESLLSGEAGGPSVAVGPSGLAGIFYTGGTTGFPKGVMLTHQALWAAGMALQPATRTTDESRVLHAAPMFHLADAGSCHAGLIVGAANVYIPRFTPLQTIETIESKRVTDTLLVPTMIGMLLADPAYDPSRLQGLRSLLFGASPIAESLLARLRADLPDLRLVHVYGQSEMGPPISYLEPRHQVAGARRSLSIGKPFPSVEVRIVDEAGVEVADDTPGEILARGPSMMTGYWNKPDQTAATLVDGWIKTGDVAYRDADGFMFICDRAKDMIITGGENVFSAEVENVVTGHPAVAAAAVIGIPDEQFGERVHAVVVLRPGSSLTLEALFEHCRAHLANYKCPRSLELKDQLPIAATGKVLKRDLREPYWQGRTRGVN